MPYSDIKTIPKEERKHFRNTYADGTSLNPEAELVKYEHSITTKWLYYCTSHSLFFRKHILLSINQVTRELEKRSMCCIIITEDVTPTVLVKHIVDLAVLRDTPLLIMPNLRNILSEKVGISSTVFGIKNLASNCRLETIAKVIIDTAKKYPVPVEHHNYKRIKKNLSDAKDVVGTGNYKVLTKGSLNVNNVVHNNRKSCKFHLNRISRNERVFVPCAQMETVTDEAKSTNNNFITFCGVDDVRIENKKKEYRFLKVNRTRNNPRRVPQKLESIKRKK